MPAWNRVLQSAIGYHELGMSEEALRELGTIDPALRSELPTLELRGVLLVQLGRWEEAAETHAELCRADGACAQSSSRPHSVPIAQARFRVESRQASAGSAID